MARNPLLGPEEQRQFTSAARRAIRDTRRAMAGLPGEPELTGALVGALQREFRTVPGTAVALGKTLRPKTQEPWIGADLAIVLVTEVGSKWLLVQAKIGVHARGDWAALIQACGRMEGVAASRAFLYYRDQFITALGREVRDDGVAIPPATANVGAPLPVGWSDAGDAIGWFFECWGGRRGYVPDHLPADLVLVLASSRGDRDGALHLLDEFLTRRADQIKTHWQDPTSAGPDTPADVE